MSRDAHGAWAVVPFLRRHLLSYRLRDLAHSLDYTRRGLHLVRDRVHRRRGVLVSQRTTSSQAGARPLRKGARIRDGDGHQRPDRGHEVTLHRVEVTETRVT